MAQSAPGSIRNSPKKIRQPRLVPAAAFLRPLNTVERTMTTVKIEMDGAVGVVSLTKPPHNLIDDAMIADLLTAYRDRKSVV